LGLVADAGKVIGLKLADDHVVGICVNLESKVEWSFEEPFNSRGELAIYQLTNLLKRQTRKVSGQLLGIGIGVPGVVSPADLTTANSPMMGWDNVNVGLQISNALAMPVLLENDVNTLAIAESLFGRGRDTSNFITLTLGRGIGLGIVINGELYSGSHGAGEFGHVTAVVGGPLCECGKKGCLEAIAANPAILKNSISNGFVPANTTMKKLIQAARKNSILAEKIFRSPAELLGIALSNVINVLGPELIIVGGEGSEGWDLWEPWLRPALNQHVVDSMKNFSLEVDAWDDSKWALGATALVLQASLSNTTVEKRSSQEVKNRLQVSHAV
jgi:predicted NBD/HSP70 family sugar kinase